MQCTHYPRPFHDCVDVSYEPTLFGDIDLDAVVLPECIVRFGTAGKEIKLIFTFANVFLCAIHQQKEQKRLSRTAHIIKSCLRRIIIVPIYVWGGWIRCWVRAHLRGSAGSGIS